VAIHGPLWKKMTLTEDGLNYRGTRNDGVVIEVTKKKLGEYIMHIRIANHPGAEEMAHDPDNWEPDGDDDEDN
jgi:hypothetical protein